MTSATVLIVEPYATGHRGVWLRWISEELLKHEWRIVIVTLVESLQQPALAWLTAQPAIEVVAVDLPGDYASGGKLGTLLAAELRSYRLLSRLCAEARQNHFVHAILLPFGDYALHATALFGSPFGELPWVPIMMRPTFHYRARGIRAPQPTYPAVRRALFRSFVRTRSLTTCLTIDKPLYEFMSTDSTLAHKMGYLADPVGGIASVGKSQARKRLGIPAAAIVVLVYGSLTSKKGVKYLLSAASTGPRMDLHVLCVGVLDAEFRTLLTDWDAKTLIRGGRLHLIDRWADDATEAAVFAAADIVWLGYVNHWQSSGVLVQAGRAKLPAIACNEGLVGWTVSRHQCGLVVCVHQRDEVAGALEVLAASPELRTDLGQNGHRAFAAHTADKAGEIISNSLRNALTGMPQHSTGAGVMPPADLPDR